MSARGSVIITNSWPSTSRGNTLYWKSLFGHSSPNAVGLVILLFRQKLNPSKNTEQDAGNLMTVVDNSINQRMIRDC